MSQQRRIERNVDIIYTGLKELHKNGRSAKKKDGDSGTSWFDAPYRRENNVCSVQETKDRQRTDRESWNLPLLLRNCVAPAIVMSVDELDKTTRSMQYPSHRSNKARVLLKFIYIHRQKQRLYSARVEDILETYLYDWKLNSIPLHIMYFLIRYKTTVLVLGEIYKKKINFYFSRTKLKFLRDRISLIRNLFAYLCYSL